MIQFPLLFPCFSAMASEFPLSFSYQGCAAKKKIILRVLEKLYNWTNMPLSSFLLLSVLILQKFIQFFSPSCLSPFSSFLYPASRTTFLSLFPVLFFISWHFCVPLLSIFYFHISCSFQNAVLLPRWLVTLLSVVPFNAILGMFGSKFSARFSSLFGSVFSLSFYFLLSGVFSCFFWSVSAFQCLPVGTVFMEESGCVCVSQFLPGLWSMSFSWYFILRSLSTAVLLCLLLCTFFFFFFLGQMSREWDGHFMWDWNVRTQWCLYFNCSPKTRLGKPDFNEPV